MTAKVIDDSQDEMNSPDASPFGHNHRSLLPDAIQLKLLWVIQDKELSARKFLRVCNDIKDTNGLPLFGEAGSALRRSVQRERDYLLKNPKYLQRALSSFIDLPAETSIASAPSPYHSSRKSTDAALKPTILFPSPNPPCPTFNMSLSAGDSTNESSLPPVPLVFNKPWETGYGIVCLMCRDVTVDGRVVDRVRIIKPIFDMRDSKKYQARITVHGNGIIAEEPAAPHYLLDREMWIGFVLSLIARRMRLVRFWGMCAHRQSLLTKLPHSLQKPRLIAESSRFSTPCPMGSPVTIEFSMAMPEEIPQATNTLSRRSLSWTPPSSPKMPQAGTLALFCPSLFGSWQSTIKTMLCDALLMEVATSMIILGML